MNYYIFVIGCQQNYYDADKIAHLLNQMGYFESDEKNADLIIVLGCSVRKKPVDKIFSKVENWKKLPQNPKVIITGCMLPIDKKKFKDRVDAIIDVKEIETELPKLLNIKLEIRNLKLEIGNKSNSFIPIMYGCDNFCTYCAVPYTRGREVSRNVDEILDEIKSMIKNGINKITLLGQNVNSYKSSKHLNIKTSKQKNDFVELLKKIEKIEGLKEIYFLTAHPKDMSDGLIEWMKNSKKFSKELHLPLQSGDDEILKKMNRHYTSGDFIKLVAKIRKATKLKFFSTDIIVGFPTETEKQFKNTFDICKQIGFDKAFVSQFSSRAGTPAAKMKDDVSSIEKKKRWKIINDLINK